MKKQDVKLVILEVLNFLKKRYSKEKSLKMEEVQPK